MPNFESLPQFFLIMLIRHTYRERETNRFGFSDSKDFKAKRKKKKNQNLSFENFTPKIYKKKKIKMAPKIC